jgi:hypothetical protein
LLRTHSHQGNSPVKPWRPARRGKAVPAALGA